MKVRYASIAFLVLLGTAHSVFAAPTYVNKPGALPSPCYITPPAPGPAPTPLPTPTPTPGPTPGPSGTTPHYLKAQVSGLCLKAETTPIQETTRLIQGACDSAALPIVETAYGAAFELRVANTNFCVDIYGGGTLAQNNADGNSAQLFTCLVQSNQRFTPTSYADGTRSFSALSSGKCLDITGWSTLPGAYVQQWTCTGGSQQKFISVATSGGATPSPAPTPTPTPTPTPGTPPPTTPPPAGTNPYSPYIWLQAENYQTMQGVIRSTDITDLDNGDWTKYTAVNFGSQGARGFIAHLGVPAAQAGGIIEVRLDSVSNTPIARLQTVSTGAWGTYTYQAGATYSLITGVHDVYLTFQGQEVAALNAFGFVRTTPSPVNPLAPAPTTVTLSNLPPVSTSLTTASITYTKVPANSTNTVYCRLDTATPITCPNPFALTNLAVGAHKVDYYIDDGYGYNAASPRVSYTWSIFVAPTPPPTPGTPPPSPGPGTLPPAGTPNLLFATGFDGVQVLPVDPADCYFDPAATSNGYGCWQYIGGTDSKTGFTFPIKLFGGNTSHFQLLSMGPGVSSGAAAAVKVNQEFDNHIETVTGHDGQSTNALYQSIQRSYDGTSNYKCCTQDHYITPVGSAEGDLYVRFWLKLQPYNGFGWRTFSEIKTHGDWRFSFGSMTWPAGPNPTFYISTDNVGDGGLPWVNFWSIYTPPYLTPFNQWFKIEWFVHRSQGNDGRVWGAINGTLIADKYGPNYGIWNAGMDRLFAPSLYNDGSHPQYQWVDDFEIWSAFPPDASPH